MSVQGGRGLSNLDDVMFFYCVIVGRRKGKVLDSCDEGLSKKDLALQQAIDQITTSFGKGSIMWLGRSAGSKSVPVISTGSFALDIALGIGGVPKVLAFFVDLFV